MDSVEDRTEDTAAEDSVVEFVQAMPGFEEARHFLLVEMEGVDALCTLQCLEQPEVSFLVAPPAVFFPDYEPEVDEDVVHALGIGAVEDVLLLTVINAGESVAETTVNLLAPILVNLKNRKAAQTVLDERKYPIAAALTLN